MLRAAHWCGPLTRHISTSSKPDTPYTALVNKTRIGINGFGRIGRTLCRLLHGHPQIAVALVNDLADAPTLAHLLKYDSIHGVLPQAVSAAEANATFEAYSQNSFREILQYTEDPIVSIDINNSCYSSTFDSQMTSVIGSMVKIIGWYDNEMGYSSRIVDTIGYLQAKGFI